LVEKQIDIERNFAVANDWRGTSAWRLNPLAVTAFRGLMLHETRFESERAQSLESISVAVSNGFTALGFCNDGQCVARVRDRAEFNDQADSKTRFQTGFCPSHEPPEQGKQRDIGLKGRYAGEYANPTLPKIFFFARLFLTPPA